MSSRFVAGKVLGAPDQDGRFGAQLQHFLCTTADGNGCFSTKTNDAVKLESCCRVIVVVSWRSRVCLRSESYAGHLADILMQPKPKKISPPFPYHRSFSFSISFLWSRWVGIHLTQHCLSMPIQGSVYAWLGMTGRDSPDLADANCFVVLSCFVLKGVAT